MGKHNWWSRDEYDDGIVEETTERGWLDDFEFHQAEEDDDAVGSIWGKYGGSGVSHSGQPALIERMLDAQKLVQGFVNTFATGDSRGYRVAFDESVRTAGTDFAAKVIVISHAPLADPTITADEANTVLTAMAAHESSHVRYGRRTHAAVAKAFGSEPTAMRVSNILDDVRIERRFAADYPGYASVFAPAIAYVAKSSKGDADLVDPALLSESNLMVAAVRYAEHVAWTDETAVERDWWSAWSDRWTATDSTTDHVAGVREGIEHLVERLEARPKPEPKGPTTDCGPIGGGSGGSGQPTDGPGGGTTDGGSGQTDGEPTEPTDGQPTGDPLDGVDDGDGPDLPICFADEIEHVARENGAKVASSVAAQTAVEERKSLTRSSTGNLGEVYWSPKGIARTKQTVTPSGSASAAIRAAFTRSRTGHFAVEKGLRRGRLDNRSMTRLASSDTRLFAKRTAPSEGKYLVWLLVDCSGSMGGHPMDQCIAVSAALAAASRLLPNVRLNIWGWTSGLKRQAQWSATRVWSTGEPISSVGFLDGIRKGGTPDADVLAWAVAAIQKQVGPGETPMILMASDGAGALSGDYGASIVDAARRDGVEAVSVALGWLNETAQSRVYGPKGLIPWAGSIAATARPLGQLIARATVAK